MTSKEQNQLEELIFKAVCEGLLVSGHLTEKDIVDGDALRSKVGTILNRGEMELSIDHRELLLPNAVRFASEGAFELALMFYATYYEHTINGIISAAVRRMKLSSNVTKGLLRTVNLEGKLTWVLEILGQPSFNSIHLKTLKNT